MTLPRTPYKFGKVLEVCVWLFLPFRHVVQGSIQIVPKVLDGLNTHAQSQQCRRQVLLPRNAGPPFDGGLDRAQAGGVLDELQSGAHGVGGGRVATHVERDNRAEALELAPRGRVSWVARQTGI